MSNMIVTLANGETLTFLQVMRIHELGNAMDGYEWHKNDCGCCVTVHPKDNHHAGYVIDSGGGYEWIDLGPHTHAPNGEPTA
jgi:hypothetical protein